MLLLLPALVTAQGPPPLPPADGPKVAVSGLVLSGERPIRGAKVVIQAVQGTELGTTFSDGAGRWNIPEAPAGDFFVKVVKSGYPQQMHGILIPASGELDGVDLQVDRFAVLAGAVTDHRGRPVVGADVQVLTEQDFEGAARYAPAQHNGVRNPLTDDRGEYRFWSLTPGRYKVAVTPPLERAAVGVIRLESAPAFYPGVDAIAEAEAVELDWGSIREGLDVRLPEAARTQVDVAVALGQGPCESCSLQINGAGPSSALLYGRAGPATTGVHRVERLPAGEYRFSAQGVEEATRTMLQGIETVMVREGHAESVGIQVAREAPLTVRVVLDDPPDELIADAARPWHASMLLMPAPEDRQFLVQMQKMFDRIQSTDREATVEIATLPGRRKLEIHPPGGAYVAAVTLDGRPLESAWIDAPPEGLGGELTVRLRFDTGQVEGRVDQTQVAATAGIKPARIMILVERDSHGAGFERQRPYSTEPDGSFAFALAPGEYSFVAFEPQPGLPFPTAWTRNPELRKRAQRIAVQSGETTRIHLKAP